MADLSRIQFKRTSTKGRRPDAGTMNPGELAINLADQYLLTKNDSGAIINLSCPPVYDRQVRFAGKVDGDNYILGKTANYMDDSTARDLDKFGAFRTNNADGWSNLILNIPHSNGKAHGRGFEFQYGSSSSQVKTYGFDKDGNKRFSYRMYHEGDKPTPGELNVYSKQEVDRMFVKNVKLATVPVDTVEGYFKLATAMIPQNGRSVFFRIHGGNGYNVTAYDQVDIVEIVIRSGNNRPKGVNVIAYRRNTNKSFDVLAVNTSGDNYDIYVKYQRYTDNVIVEFGKSVDVNLTVHDVPDFVAERPAGDNVIGGRAVTLFNTENKRGVLSFDDNTQNSYDIVHLSNDRGTGRKYIRKFRSNYNEMVWHETVQGAVYRLATGVTDSTEVLRVDSNSAIPGSYKGYVITGKMELHGSGNAMTLHRQTDQAAYMAWWDRRDGKNQRSGYIGHADGTSDGFVWRNDVGANSFDLEGSGQVNLTTGKTKIVYTNGQYYSANSDAYRMIFGNYGAFWRNDGTKIYLLSTEENDRFGGWNGNRPFIYDLTNGKVTLGGDGNEGALVLERDSRAARFAGDVYVEKGFLHFSSGRQGASGFMKINHLGDSASGRHNILQIEDPTGIHFSTERNDETGNITARFKGFVRVESGEIAFDANRGAQSQFTLHTWGNEQRKQVFECKDATSYHWYTERTQGGAGPILFSMAGSLNVASNITTTGADISFKRTGNKHIWFRDPNGLELGLMYCDDAGVIRFRGQKQGQAWKFADKMIQLESGTVTGGGNGLIRGEVAGGSWASWRDRAAGLMVGCPQSVDSAHNVWKATHWGKYHIAAMGVHVPSGTITNALARLNVHDANFDFNASGDMSVGRNGSFNDVYIRSDARLKINKEEYKENATDKVNRLTVYTYDKVKSLTDRTVIAHEVGIIAQDLEKELPEAVTTSKVGDPDKPEEILTISNSAVNALLIKAFQEMSEELKAVKAELAELKKN